MYRLPRIQRFCQRDRSATRIRIERHCRWIVRCGWLAAVSEYLLLGFEFVSMVAARIRIAGDCRQCDFYWCTSAFFLSALTRLTGIEQNNAQYLIATGSFTLNSTTFHLARWDFDALAWSSLGGATAFPGPATAVTSSNGNEAKIFVAGISLANTPYLSYWNGSTWSDINNNTLQAGSGVEQLVFLPTLSDHSENPIVESNRMLLVSGALRINGTDYASALYDGVTWYPYLRAATATGGTGVVSRLVYSMTNFNLSSRRQSSLRFFSESSADSCENRSSFYRNHHPHFHRHRSRSRFPPRSHRYHRRHLSPEGRTELSGRVVATSTIRSGPTTSPDVSSRDCWCCHRTSSLFIFGCAY